MKLSFGTEVNHQPNYFLEKIWVGLLQGQEQLQDQYNTFQWRYISKFGKSWDGDTFGEFLEPKIHTIRRDLDRQWRSGMEIQLVINLNSQDEFQFAPTLICQSVQHIQIDYSNLLHDGPAVFVDYELLDRETLSQLAINDGFPTIDDFFFYFNEEFSGSLIHWTNMRYD